MAHFSRSFMGGSGMGGSVRNWHLPRGWLVVVLALAAWAVVLGLVDVLLVLIGWR